ncbi:NAD-dependent epimerase/dehydratase family protein [Peribacillus acanthi]|uniref:NAD-dependent epimerase/dehydratase family protein n=1 Tax=Peribacillus acanthi TaxID=2171554 RepID=UPI000D3E47A4|nr:NAD-dependent epimerase/dehydratase family protein [Peribacillus acanthi]
MNVLITGGAGFIGSFIVEEVIKQGWNPIIVDNLSTGNHMYVPQNVPFYNVDICSNSLEQVFREYNPTIVIHQAAQTSVEYSKMNPILNNEINVAGTLNILNNCVKYKVTKIIFASSAAVYGETSCLPIEEDSSLCPKSFYGLSKLNAEQYIRLYHDNFGLSFTILRYGNVYGMRQNPLGEAGVVSIFFDRILRDSPVTIYGEGCQTRDFIFVKDVAKANIQAISFGHNEIFNISTDTQVSILHLLNQIQTVLGKEAVVNFKPNRIGDIDKSSLSNKKAKELLKWIPESDFMDGITETMQYYRSLYCKV